MLVAGISHAQQQAFKQKTPNPAAKNFSQVGISEASKNVKEMLKSGAPFNQQEFDTFFVDMLYPHFTIPANFQNFATNVNLPRMRRDAKAYFALGKDPPSHERFNEVTLKFMDEVAQDTYYPAARATAMIMIADLTDINNNQPWKKALPALLKGVTAETSIDAVRIPALRGLVRHAQAGIDQASRAEVTTAMLAVLKESKPPATRSAEGHDWIRRRAIDALAAIGEPGANNAVVDTLRKTIDDDASSISVRSAAAAGLANIKLTPSPGLDATGLAKSMGRVAVDGYKAEVAEAARDFKPIAADRLKSRLTELRRGLVGEAGKGGIKLLATAAPAQQFVDAVVKEIDGLSTAAGTAPLTQPIFSPSQSGGGAAAVIPIDTQEPLRKALVQAGGSLEGLLQRGEAGAPAESAPLPPGAGPAPAATGALPPGLPGLPPG
jgi:hypothetical protein